MTPIEKYFKAKELLKEVFKEEIFYKKIPILDCLRHDLPVNIINPIEKNPTLANLHHLIFWTALHTRDFFYRLTHKPKPTQESDTLLILNSVSHVRTIIPVLKKLKSPIKIIANGSGAQKALDKENIGYIPFEKYKTKKGKIEVNSEHPKYKRIKYITKTWFKKTIKQIEATENLLNKEKPKKVIVLNENNMFGRTFVRVANLNNIETLYIQHGVLATHAYDKAISNKIAVWGEQVKDFLVERGTDPNKIIITGSPGYDKLFNFKSDKNKIYQELNLDPNKEIVLYTSQPFGFEISKENNLEIMTAFIKAVKNIPNKHAVIKLHPAEHETSYKSLLKTFKKEDYTMCKETNIYELIDAAEILITQISTTALEAMILNKNIITVTTFLSSAISPYGKSKAALEVSNLDELQSTLKKILTDKELIKELEENRKKFVYSYNYKCDGKATDRIIELIT